MFFPHILHGYRRDLNKRSAWCVSVYINRGCLCLAVFLYVTSNPHKVENDHSSVDTDQQNEQRGQYCMSDDVLHTFGPVVVGEVEKVHDDSRGPEDCYHSTWRLIMSDSPLTPVPD